ncbi:DUF5808 domain-containing protein [Cohnella sp. GCM10027633]|uniref:DUF5808 domain-containing protein n=1 Tax=unclassified Cohnella TaxID=2636738 RepID=UPI0036433060
MLTIVLLIPATILYIVLIATYKPQGRYREGKLLSIELPSEAMEDAELLRIQQRYNRQLARISLWSIVAFVPVALMWQWFAAQTVYFFLWLTVFLFVTVGPFRRAFRDTIKLKRDRGWGDTVEDEYWANGFTYHNPQDKRISVPKRVGIGMTVNTGTLAGRTIMQAVIALVAGVLLFASFLIIRAEFVSPTLTVTPEERIEIDYPMHGYDFALADVRGMTLVDGVPSGGKINGENSTKYKRGTFRLKEIGKSRVFIFKDNPPYIRFELDNTYVFYNDRDSAETRKLFEQLQTRIDR